MVLRNVITTPLTCGAHASVASRIRNRCLLSRRRGNGGGAASGDLLPMQDRELTVLAFHERGEALDPVPVIAIENAANRSDLGLVDVPAHHAIDAAATRFLRQRDLEIGDVAHRILHLVLEELRQRPVWEAEPCTGRVEPAVEV